MRPLTIAIGYIVGALYSTRALTLALAAFLLGRSWDGSWGWYALIALVGWFAADVDRDARNLWRLHYAAIKLREARLENVSGLPFMLYSKRKALERFYKVLERLEGK